MMATLDEYFKIEKKKKIIVKEKKVKKETKERVCECGSKKFTCYLEGKLKGVHTRLFWCSKCNKKSHLTEEKIKEDC